MKFNRKNPTNNNYNSKIFWKKPKKKMIQSNKFPKIYKSTMQSTKIK